MKSATYKQKYQRRIEKYAAVRGGEVLTTYESSTAKMRFRCAEGHEFETRVSQMLGRKTWCPICGRNAAKKTVLAKSWATLQKIVQKKGGTIVSDVSEYRGLSSRIRVRCREGHEWTTLAMSIRQGKWCGLCSRPGRKYKPQEYLQSLFRKAGYKVLEPLTQGMKGRYLVLDEQGLPKKISPYQVIYALGKSRKTIEKQYL